MKGLPKNLFKTFIFATIIAMAANSAYYVIIQHNKTQDYQHAIQLITGGTFFITFILTIMSLPMLFLSNAEFWNSLWTRLVLYFSGPVVFIITILTMNLSPANKLFDFIAGVIFILIHLYFYYRTVKRIS